MVQEPQNFPALPNIGLPDATYARAIQVAVAEGDVHTREAYKIARYLSLAAHPKLTWPDKLKYYQHALRKHCAPPFPDDEVVKHYHRLAEVVREHCGAEALRLASQEDDMYAARSALGEERSKIEDDAEIFFGDLLGTGDQCPDYFNEVDWQQLKLIRDQWI
jgi:hypothetical protein